MHAAVLTAAYPADAPRTITGCRELSTLFFWIGGGGDDGPLPETINFSGGLWQFGVCRSVRMALVHQETWVRFGTNGIGISDHQNRYSNGVRVGNWTENEFGHEMAATVADHHKFTSVSTAQ
ncbi:MAG: hypothetical protein ACPIOQ_81635, partial [Promethearchaeia archaeon]